MNLADAQAAARKDPKLRAAVASSNRRARPGAGITDDPAVDVELFPLVKDATAVFKGRKELLEKDGFVVTYGTIAKGLVILEREEAAVSMALVKREIPQKGDGQDAGKA